MDRRLEMMIADTSTMAWVSSLAACAFARLAFELR
jgi:hypothetical protein